MFAYLIGTVMQVDEQQIVLENQGIGYLLHTSATSAAKLALGEKVKLYTQLFVREDALTLYAFYDENERLFFDLLTKVSSIGPKVALAALSTFAVSDLQRIIATGDVNSLTKTPGIAKKTASRIILELAETVQSLFTISEEEPVPSARPSEIEEIALEALVNLGYPRQEAKRALEKAPVSDSLESLIREALRQLGNN